MVLDHLVDGALDVAAAAPRAACRRPAAAGGSGPTPWIARCSASRTKVVVRPGRELGEAGARAACRCCRLALMPVDAYVGAMAETRRWLPSVPVPVEPPPPPWALRRPAAAHDADDDLVGGRRRPRAGHAAGGLPAGAVPDAVRRTPGDPMCWWSPGAARGPARSTALRVSRSLRRSCRRLRDPGRHRLRRGPRRRAPTPARRRGWIDADIRDGVRASCTSWAGRTPSRPGGTGGSPVGCTASRSAACSRASRCSTGSGTPPRWRWSGWWTCCATSTATDRLIDVQWGTPHLASLGVVEISRSAYLRRLPGVLAVPAPPRLRLTRPRASHP